MRFDITDLDKKRLVQAFLNFSTPTGMGAIEYVVRAINKDNPNTIPDWELENALAEFNQNDRTGSFRIFDYYKGHPLKLIFYRKKNGQVIIDTLPYDIRNGRFFSLLAMLSEFAVNEVKIIQKKVPLKENCKKKHPIVESIFKEICKNLEMKKDRDKKYYVMNKENLKELGFIYKFICKNHQSNK